MVVKRLVVGAHYGLRDWLAQRITAVIMAAYAVVVLVLMAQRAPFTYEAWKALFAHGGMRIATLLFAVSLAWHAWVGARDILMDYIKLDGLRLALQVATVLLLAGYVGWAIEILWR
jgi:succinate dehydrogenase / fumarate reductase membrane anchor subunit